MNLLNKTFISVKWVFLSTLVQAITSIIVLAVLARHLSPSDFGLMAIATIINNFLTLFSELGLGASLIQRKNINEAHIKGAFTTSMIMSLILVVLLYCIAPMIADFFNAVSAANIIRIIGLSFPIISFGMVSNALLQKNMEFEKIFWIEISAYVFGYAFVSIILALNGFGVWSIVLSVLCQNVINSIMLCVVKPYSLIPGLPKREISELLSFGGGLSLARLILYFANQGDYAIVGKYMNPGILGLYERIMKIMILPGQYLGNILDRVMFPAMAEIQNDYNSLKDIYLKAMSIVNFIMIPISVVLIITCREIVNLLLGPKWDAAIIPLQVLFFGITFRTTVRISDSTIRALGAVYPSAKRKAIYAVAIIIGCWVGHFYGLIGIAIAVNIAVLINYALMTQMTIKLLKIKYINLFETLYAGIIMVLIVFVISIFATILIRAISHNVILKLTFIAVIEIIGLGVLYHLFPNFFKKNIRWALKNIKI